MLTRLAIFNIIFILIISGCTTSSVSETIAAHLESETQEEASQVWQTPPALDAPNGLRPCCAFGYNLKVKAWGIPIPFYRIDNIVEASTLGDHRYNDNFWLGTAAVLGIGSEKSGIVYSHKGGFLDIAHIRDTADYTYYLFSHIYPKLGQEWTLTLSDELAQRKIHFNRFTPPSSDRQRYTLSAYLAARLAYRLAVWHEIAQWYGYRSVAGFSEGISAFSPEDLYSNLMGARLSLTLILNGDATNLEHYNQSMQRIIPSALAQLEAQPRQATQQWFDLIDGQWWNSQERVPDKFLVLKRDYHLADKRYPVLPFGETTPPHYLTLPDVYAGYSLKQLAEFQLWPTKQMANLPIPKTYWEEADFADLAEKARQIDQKTRPKTTKND
ncbi:DUF4056 domain-containing protein [Proteus mirabilis]|uniref:DUF4056 domain-containing protein n=1 Tax=Proteus mirabilis TaxID=584 RepID=UPI001FABCD69|nr:DUF4056 domain-containing protein [Proteus mirabilis]MCI9743327.1 DUF4056 domain-containing protein [Proteus mirabilis]MCI9812647.1 DUF4056 domain-containing protein [Proteus mirabilis]